MSWPPKRKSLRSLGHSLRRALSAMVVVSALVGATDEMMLKPWPAAHDLISPLAAAAGASSSGGPSNQVETGRGVYLRECARCHGPIDSEGITAPGLFGAEPAKKLASFQTSQALFTFIRFAMPQDKPGSLPEEDYWAVLAFVLARNGFIAETASPQVSNTEGISLKR
jgi:S-disulfanyl-L-cysteine oxidoreductase SoxD